MGIADFLFSCRCKLCNRQLKKGSICSVCDLKLNSKINLRKRTLYTDTSKIECYYLFDYDEDTKRILFALKRNADKHLLSYAASLYGQCVPEDFNGTVTCVPRRRMNVRNFGYDHVEIPCKIMSKQLNLDFLNIIKRKGLSKNQKNLNSAQRQENVRGKFRIIKKDIPKNILLADDVVTTGNTFIECAKVLLEANPHTKITGIFLASGNRAGSPFE